MSPLPSQQSPGAITTVGCAIGVRTGAPSDLTLCAFTVTDSEPLGLGPELLRRSHIARTA
jgi:hypothetical protein